MEKTIMGISTKGFVDTSCKDVIFITERIESALNRMIRASDPAREGLEFFRSKQSSLCQIRLSPTIEMASITFRIHGEDRDLKVFFACDCDHTDVCPTSISLSIRCWGHSREIVLTALQALSCLGDCYFDENDCDDKDYELLDLAPASFVQACMQGVETGSCVSITRWIRAAKAMARSVLKPADVYRRVLGMPLKQAQAIQALDYEASREEVEALCKLRETAT